MLFVSAQTVAKKHRKNGDMSRCPSIKSSDLVKNCSAPMSASFRSGHSLVSCRSPNASNGVLSKFPAGSPLDQQNSRVGKVVDSNKQLPKSVNIPGILTPPNAKTEKIRSRRPCNGESESKTGTSLELTALEVTRRKSESRLYPVFSPIVSAQVLHRKPKFTHTISTNKEPADATQTCTNKQECLKKQETLNTEHKQHPENLQIKTNCELDDVENLSCTDKEQLGIDNRQSFSFSPKTRHVRTNLMRKFLEVKVRTKSLCMILVGATQPFFAIVAIRPAHR